MSVRGRIKKALLQRLDGPQLRQMIREECRESRLQDLLVFGDKARLEIHPTAVVNNSLFNTASGTIKVGPWAGLAHSVSVLTGTHEASKFGEDRHRAIPQEGRDIVIEEGVWIASNATVLGPCVIGRHAVVAAGSVVVGDVRPYAVVAGVPAREVKRLDP